MCLAARNRQKIHKTPILALKVIQVIAFGGNRKPVYDFLLVININLSPISHSYWDTATYWLKSQIFSFPLIQRPRLKWAFLNLWKSFTILETRIFQGADGENLVILTSTVFDWSIRVTDTRTDRIATAKTR